MLWSLAEPLLPSFFEDHDEDAIFFCFLGCESFSYENWVSNAHFISLMFFETLNWILLFFDKFIALTLKFIRISWVWSRLQSLPSTILPKTFRVWSFHLPGNHRICTLRSVEVCSLRCEQRYHYMNQYSLIFFLLLDRGWHLHGRHVGLSS